jgi:hypothetical protein
MRRAVKYVGVVLALAGAAAFGLVVGPSIWIAWAKNREAHCMHEGHVIVDQIKAQDPSINATWTLDDDGQPDVVIRNVFDREKQDMILAWAKAVKQQGRVHRRISLDFQQETPHSSLPDTILRTEHF